MGPHSCAYDGKGDVSAQLWGREDFKKLYNGIFLKEFYTPIGNNKQSEPLNVSLLSNTNLPPERDDEHQEPCMKKLKIDWNNSYQTFWCRRVSQTWE